MFKFIVLLIFALFAAGAFCMANSTYWVFDVLGFALMAVGCIVGTIKAFRVKDKKKKILLLCLLYLALVLLTVAGSVLFSGTILIAIPGAAALVVFGFLIMKKPNG